MHALYFYVREHFRPTFKNTRESQPAISRSLSLSLFIRVPLHVDSRRSRVWTTHGKKNISSRLSSRTYQARMYLHAQDERGWKSRDVAKRNLELNHCHSTHADAMIGCWADREQKNQSIRTSVKQKGRDLRTYTIDP